MPHTELPTFAQAVGLIARCERGEMAANGEAVSAWIEYADAQGIFHFPTIEYVQALAEELQRLAPKQIVEVAAGDGKLAQALCARGLDVAATDANAEANGVRRMTAGEALAKFQPDLVIGCWAPIDTGIDAQVMRWPSVRTYVYIGHEHNGIVGHEGLWQAAGWRHRRLESADAHNLGRTDFCLSFDPPEIVQHGWTMVLERDAGAGVC